jgi:transglutaminase-like putative cysteine protease
MELKTWPLESKYQTVAEIKNMVDKYHGDLRSFPDLVSMPLPEYFFFVKNIPYIRDIKNSEIVSRPKYLLTLFPALDCKKKSILMGSFMRLKHGPGSYRFCLSSNRPDGNIGHVFTQVFCNGRWINADATYSHNKLGAVKKVTNFEIVRG